VFDLDLTILNVRLDAGHGRLFPRAPHVGRDNPLRSFTGVIHVYGGDFFGMPRSEWAPDTLEESPFDVERAKRAYALANDRCNMDTA